MKPFIYNKKTLKLVTILYHSFGEQSQFGVLTERIPGVLVEKFYFKSSLYRRNIGSPTERNSVS